MPKWNEAPKVGSFVKAYCTCFDLFTKGRIYQVLPPPLGVDNRVNNSVTFYMKLDRGDVARIHPMDFVQAAPHEVIRHALIDN